jgi:HEAT repeat protein
MRLLCFLLLSLSLSSAQIDDARKTLTDAAHGKEGDARREVAIALSLIASKDPAAALIEDLLKDKDYLVRVAAVDTLGELNDKSRIPLLKTALSDDVPEVAFAAAKALYAMKDPAGIEALEAVYERGMKAKSGFVKKEIMTNMRRLKTPRSAFFFAVEHGIGFVPLPGVGTGYNALMGMLADAEFSARAVSLLMVCREKNKACDAMLAPAFTDEDWTVRAAAVHVAATKAGPAWQSNVATLLTDKKDKVRLRAAAGFLRMEANKTPVKKPTRPSVKKG